LSIFFAIGTAVFIFLPTLNVSKVINATHKPKALPYDTIY
jgi:hypothetical protein